jgi:hypothetical protein
LFDISHYLLMLLFPLGASLLLTLIFCIFDTVGVMELDRNIQGLLNDYNDLNKTSVYIALVTVSFE